MSSSLSARERGWGKGGRRQRHSDTEISPFFFLERDTQESSLSTDEQNKCSTKIEDISKKTHSLDFNFVNLIQNEKIFEDDFDPINVMIIDFRSFYYEF